MKTLNLLILLALIIIGNDIYAQKADFTGKYVLNNDKTQFADHPKFLLAKSLTVKQSANQAIISRINLSPDLTEKSMVTDSVTINGDVFKRPLPGVQGSFIASTCKWLDDSTLELTQDVTDANGKLRIRSIEKWSYENDGKTLKVARHIKQADGSYLDIVGYYNKN